MAKQHKYHNSRIEALTTLPVDTVLNLVAQVAERQRTIRMVGRDGTSARLNVKNLMGGTIIEFVVATSSDGYRTRVTCRMENYSTSRMTYFYVIPISPRYIDGYGEYRRFMRSLQEAITAADPSSRSSIIEKDNSM